MMDQYNDGVNDYVFEDFVNNDHLGPVGAIKMATRIDSLLKTLE